jgi:hypothetical protein
MAQSLDKVLQPDGTYKWELVELNDVYVGRAKAEPAKEPAEQPRSKRRTKFSDTSTETPES